mmetsp:Transcript_89477/g.154973  ORF Transcript_89477/g.154973 Transcript_89477/m.154973 type:complete len:94 (+) Transcript_89477:1250-1531(+)
MLMSSVVMALVVRRKSTAVLQNSLGGLSPGVTFDDDALELALEEGHTLSACLHAADVAHAHKKRNMHRTPPKHQKGCSLRTTLAIDCYFFVCS